MANNGKKKLFYVWVGLILTISLTAILLSSTSLFQSRAYDVANSGPASDLVPKANKLLDAQADRSGPGNRMLMPAAMNVNSSRRIQRTGGYIPRVIELQPTPNPSLCGNSKLDRGEVCDDGNNVDGDGCSANCNSQEMCGNGILDIAIGEQCEPPNQKPCSVSCKLMKPPRCGDNVLDPDEMCDDGNNVDGDGCSANCKSQETCGNGILDRAAREECEPPSQGLCSRACKWR